MWWFVWPLDIVFFIQFQPRSPFNFFRMHASNRANTQDTLCFDYLMHPLVWVLTWKVIEL